MTRSPKERLTRDEYLQLVGLVTIARQYAEDERKAMDAIGRLMGIGPEHPERDTIGDVIFHQRDIEWYLTRLNVSVDADSAPNVTLNVTPTETADA